MMGPKDLTALPIARKGMIAHALGIFYWTDEEHLNQLLLAWPDCEQPKRVPEEIPLPELPIEDWKPGPV